MKYSIEYQGHPLLTVKKMEILPEDLNDAIRSIENFTPTTKILSIGVVLDPDVAPMSWPTLPVDPLP